MTVALSPEARAIEGVLIAERLSFIRTGEKKNLVRARTGNRTSKRRRQHNDESKQYAQASLHWILLNPDEQPGPRKSCRFQPRAKS